MIERSVIPIGWLHRIFDCVKPSSRCCWVSGIKKTSNCETSGQYLRCSKLCKRHLWSGEALSSNSIQELWWSVHCAIQSSPQSAQDHCTIRRAFCIFIGMKGVEEAFDFFCAEHDVEHETYSAWTWQDLGLKGRSRLQLSRHPEFCLACSPAVAWQCKYVNIAKCEPCQSRFEIPRGLETSRI